MAWYVLVRGLPIQSIPLHPPPPKKKKTEIAGALGLHIRTVSGVSSRILDSKGTVPPASSSYVLDSTRNLVRIS